MRNKNQKNSKAKIIEPGLQDNIYTSTSIYIILHQYLHHQPASRTASPQESLLLQLHQHKNQQIHFFLCQ